MMTPFSATPAGYAARWELPEIEAYSALASEVAQMLRAETAMHAPVRSATRRNPVEPAGPLGATSQAAPTAAPQPTSPTTSPAASQPGEPAATGEPPKEPEIVLADEELAVLAALDFPVSSQLPGGQHSLGSLNSSTEPGQSWSERSGYGRNFASPFADDDRPIGSKTGGTTGSTTGSNTTSNAASNTGSKPGQDAIAGHAPATDQPGVIGKQTTASNTNSNMADAELASHNPYLARLLPAASKWDTNLATDFRQLTGNDIANTKAEGLELFAELIKQGASHRGRILIPKEDGPKTAAALTDIRLVLGVQLGIKNEADSERLEHEAMLWAKKAARTGYSGAASDYQFLVSLYLVAGAALESLLQCLLDEL